MGNKDNETKKSNKGSYIAIALITCLVGAFIVVLQHWGSKVVEKNEDPKKAMELAKEGHKYVQVHSDTLRKLCRCYEGLDKYVFAAEDGALFCNISVPASAQNDVVEELFTPDRAEYPQELDNTNAIKLRAEILPNKDTVVTCPVVMLFHLVQNYEKKNAVQ